MSKTETTAEIEERIGGWFASQIPDGWFTGAPQVRVDREEILVVGALSEPQGGKADEAAQSARIAEWREETREKRIQIASKAEAEYNRKVSWGAVIGDTRRLFTTASVPVMTRLRLNERAVLDTLVQAGVARSRSDALAWCVRLVGRHESDWLNDLRDALGQVRQVRSEGPTTI